MKQQFFKFFFAGILSLLLSQTTNAQCSYSIRNDLGCPVDVIVTIYDKDPVTGICHYCKSYPDIALPGMGIGVNCVGCPNICNIEIEIVAIGGVPVPPGSVADFSTPSAPAPSPGQPCTPPATPVTIDYRGAFCTFVIHP